MELVIAILPLLLIGFVFYHIYKAFNPDDRRNPEKLDRFSYVIKYTFSAQNILFSAAIVVACVFVLLIAMVVDVVSS